MSLIAIRASGASIGDVSGDRDGATPFVSISAALYADAYAHPDLDRTHPGVTEHRFGKGRCVYLAFAPKAYGLPNLWTIGAAVPQPPMHRLESR